MLHIKSSSYEVCICICKSKPLPTDKLVECHGQGCKNGKFFHLPCLNLKRMPNNHRTTWKCSACKKAIAVQATTCSSSSGSDSSDENIDVVITKVCEGETDKTGTSSKMTDSHFDSITSPSGWLDMRIWQLMAFSSLCLVQLEILTLSVVNL